MEYTDPNLFATIGTTTIIIASLINLPLAIVVNLVARDKGRNVTLLTLLAIIPLVSIYAVIYTIGVSSKIQDKKLDRIRMLLYKESI